MTLRQHAFTRSNTQTFHDAEWRKRLSLFFRHSLFMKPEQQSCSRRINTTEEHSEAGFTLLEMIAVVAIIGVLASIAVPRYQLYVARSQVSSAYLLLKGQQISVEDHLLRGKVPTMSSLGYSGQNVKHLHGKWNVTSQGALHYDFGEGSSPSIEKGSWLELRPGDTTRGWHCVAGGNLAKELIPTGCQAESGSGAKLTASGKE